MSGWILANEVVKTFTVELVFWGYLTSGLAVWGD